MRRVALALASLVVFALALGQSSTSGATVQVKNSDTYGTYLVDAKGMSLYVLSSDSKGTSTCTGDCAKAWPPLTTTGKPTAGSGVAGSLLGTFKRSDGSEQITYNGLPLYGFVKDQKPGDTNGEGIKAFGGEWDLVSPYGSAVKPPAKQPAASSGSSGAMSGSSVSPAAMKGGETTYSNICSACHGQSGEGGKGPAFVGFEALKNTNRIIIQVLRGGRFMPPLGSALSDKQIADVLTYIRNSWGNSYGPVSAKEVTQSR